MKKKMLLEHLIYVVYIESMRLKNCDSCGYGLCSDALVMF